MYKRFLALLLSLAFSTLVLGQAGKLSGIVKDKATGEPLPGVNVVVNETLLGGSSDVDGFFTILNVPPGTYRITFSYIGYQTVEMENIRIVNDITKRLEISLSPTTLELDEAIIVVADKPFFEAAATNTVRVLDSEEIERIPVKGVNSIVSVNAGVVASDGSGGETGNATLNVRGGRGNETLYVVDGVPINNALLGGAAGTIPDAAIEQVSSQLGGFTAKYGSAQSAVVNITTKSGSSRYFGGLEVVGSGFGSNKARYQNYTEGLTESEIANLQNLIDENDFADNYTGLDDYGYNQLTAHLGGPLIPGNSSLTFFTSFEYLNTQDENPRAAGLVIPTAGINQNFLPDNEGRVYRFTGKVDAYLFQKVKMTGSLTGSFRDERQYTHSYAKSNSFHNPIVDDNNISGSFKMSHIINENTFWDLNIRGKNLKWQRFDGVFGDDLFAYGDAQANAAIGVDLPPDENGNPVNGGRVLRGAGDAFWPYGRVFNNHTKYRIETFGADFNFTRQLENHLIEIGTTAQRDEVRYYSIAPLDLMSGVGTTNEPSRDERYYAAANLLYGYDLYGNEIDSDNLRSVAFRVGQPDEILETAAPQPITAALYLQDRIEFQDFILNLGLRWDYFDPDFDRLKNPADPLSAGTRGELDVADFEPAPTESYLSPRLGFAFPVSERTVFHAQYGIFRQAPRLFDLYDSWINLDVIEQRDGQGQNNGHLQSETTVQYEFGFKQQFSDVASLDVTAYYKNVKGLTNVVTVVAEPNNYISTINSDFGTIKGIATSFTLRRIGPLSAKFDYTLALNEGTGSSQSSSQTATFRNVDGGVPKSIAPVDFDQRHTLNANFDIRAAKDGGVSIGDWKPFSDAGANFLVSFNSGRPYTPREAVDPIGGNTLVNSEVANTINSAYAEGIFRIDMRMDKRFQIGRITMTPYLWIQNLLDRENFISVWESTGRPDDTAWLSTPDGQRQARQNGEEWVSDFNAFERDPTNYGIPRLVRLGLQVKF